MSFEKIKQWIKIHKIASVGIIVGIIIVGFLVSILFVSLVGKQARYRPYEYEMTKAPLALPFLKKMAKPERLPERKIEVEVKEGSMEIKSKDAESDSKEIKSIVENYEGYIERSEKRVTNLFIIVNATLRVPPERFLDLVEELKKKFEIDSYDVKNYRISIEKEIDELEILKKSLRDYEEIRGEIKAMKISEEKIELLMKVTDKELLLKQEERQYQREILTKKRQGDFASLNLTIEQKRVAKIWPENVLNRLKDRLRIAFDNSVEILRNTIGGGIELFFKVIQGIFYLAIIVIPLAITWRIGKTIYQRYWKQRLEK
jgi:hypothetical protein